MVGEFPELQGLIGGYLAEAQGEPKAVAEAVRDHYKPVGQGDDVPTAPITVAVALADKLDTLCSFWIYGIYPTGSKDPFALRRAAFGVLQLIIVNRLRLNLSSLADEAMIELSKRLHSEGDKFLALLEESHSKIQLEIDRRYEEKDDSDFDVNEYRQKVLAFRVEEDAVQTRSDAARSLLDFFADRLKVQQREAGVRHDLIDAVFALGGEDDLVRLLARVAALQSFIEGGEGANLLAGYKRAANILKKENWDLPRVMADRGEQAIPQTGEEDPLVLVDEEPELASAILAQSQGSALPANAPESERALVAALDAAEPNARAAIEAEDFGAAMAALASLRAPIDAFFETVTVNDADPAVRRRRLNILARFRDAVHGVADFSRIEG
jgi:glycyl-tRNA synthetase beta chain